MKSWKGSSSLLCLLFWIVSHSSQRLKILKLTTSSLHTMWIYDKNNGPLMTRWNWYSVSKFVLLLESVSRLYAFLAFKSFFRVIFPPKWPAKSTKFSKYNKQLFFVLSYLFGCFTSCQNSFGSTKVRKKETWKSLRTFQETKTFFKFLKMIRNKISSNWPEKVMKPARPRLACEDWFVRSAVSVRWRIRVSFPNWELSRKNRIGGLGLRCPSTRN